MKQLGTNGCSQQTIFPDVGYGPNWMTHCCHDGNEGECLCIRTPIPVALIAPRSLLAGLPIAPRVVLPPPDWRRSQRRAAWLGGRPTPPHSTGISATIQPCSSRRTVASESYGTVRRGPKTV